MKKTKRILLTLSIAALGLQTAAAQSADHFSTGAAVRSLADNGDDTSSNRYASYDESIASSVIAPTATSYDSSDLGYESYDYASLGSFGSSIGYGRRAWFTAETLLLFPADRSSPVLATVAGDGVNPLDGEAAFGGSLSSGVIGGYRLSAGFYIDPAQRIGVGARAYGTFGEDATRTSLFSADGTTSIGAPFFNPNLVPPAADAFIVAGNTVGGDPISTGGLNASESLAFFGAEGSGYLLLARGANHRFDLVAGYSFIELRNSVNHSISSTNQDTGDLIVDGTIFSTNDRFATYNRLSGAHLGVLSSVVRNRVSLSTLAKVSFGNQRVRTSIAGSGTIAEPGALPTDPYIITDTDGFYARASNIGTYESDRFGFVPELGIKLGYAFRPNVELTVGYTLWFWSTAAMAGDQIDPIVDLTGTSNLPTTTGRLSSFWIQSIDLGLGFSY